MSTATIETPVTSSKHAVRGEELLAKVKELVHQGNVKRLVVLAEDGTSVLEIPLTAGVVGAVLAPALVAIGAIAALAKHYTLLVETTGDEARSVDPEC
jgi:hypothetical protein